MEKKIENNRQLLIVTNDDVPNMTIKEVKGICKGSIVQSKHIGKDIMASFKTILGGEITSYTKMLEEAHEIAVSRMVEEAKKLGANAIIGFRLQTSSIMQGTCEIMAYGTAVVVKEKVKRTRKSTKSEGEK